jgi:hypothetical protein
VNGSNGWPVRDDQLTGNTRIDTGELNVDGRELWATRDGLSMVVSATTNQVPVTPGAFYPSAEISRT